MTTPPTNGEMPDLPTGPDDAAGQLGNAGRHSNADRHAPAEAPTSKRRSRLAIGAAALAVTGVLGGVVSVAAASEGPATVSAAENIETTRKVAVDLDTDDEAETSDLDSVTLGELADELERLGLEITIDPADDYGSDDYDSEDDEGSEDDGWDDEDWIDPFEGMTDAEIDQLSDEEFYALLEEAGIDPDQVWEDDGEWDDEGWDEDDWDEGDQHDHGDSEEPAASFDVDGDRLDTTGVSSELAAQATEIWNRFTTLIPADQRQMVSGFELMPADYDGAHVYPTEEDPTKWVLGMGADLGEDLDYILIHEFAHLLTLQAKEVPPSADGESCTTYHTGEGCALKGSTFAEFVEKFWPQEMLDRIEELYEDEDYDGLDAFYEEHKDRFVTDYAASNPGEDLAETFTHFVIEDRPTGDSIADQKVQLLWADPDMVSLRDQIRANL
jgi:hypothetical protein